MVDIFITDSRDRYDRSTYHDKILYLDGFIGECSFVDKERLASFNDTLVGLDNEANRLMLQTLDADTQKIIDAHYDFNANTFINARPAEEKIHSTLFKCHRHFVLSSNLFQLVLDKFFAAHNVSSRTLILELSEALYLAKALGYSIASSSYYPTEKHVYPKLIARQAYYFWHPLFAAKKEIKKTHIAVFLLDIPNELDLIKTFLEHIQKQDELKLTLVLIDSGNPTDKKADASKYECENVQVTHLHDHKTNLLSNYDSFYDVCTKINPLYSIYKNARLCEMEDIQYAFVDSAIKKISPDVCLYTNNQEHGRVLSNVCSSYDIPTICVEYSFFFDTYNIEKRIRFDIRACISEISIQNWAKHKDPTPRHEIIGFCKIDDWNEKLIKRKQESSNTPFQNNNRTILFVSTWAPNPKSPLLTEKAQIAAQLSEICARHGWNLLIKKHPSEFDHLIKDILSSNKYENQKVAEHHEMSLFDSIYYSDFVCTQNSTAFVEALYLNKPFSYLTINGENLWASLSYFSMEKEVGNFNSMQEYEQYLMANAGEEAYGKLLGDFLKLQNKYLYKTDGKASERLLDLARTFIK